MDGGIPCIRDVQNQQGHRDGKWIQGGQGWWRINPGTGLTVKGPKGSFQSDGKVLTLDYSDGCTTL